jgi:hypothetical protein
MEECCRSLRAHHPGMMFMMRLSILEQYKASQNEALKTSKQKVSPDYTTRVNTPTVIVVLYDMYDVSAKLARAACPV